MSEIQEWMNKIRQGIWTGLGASAKDIMQVWAVFMVSGMKQGQSYPSTKPIGIVSGRLARAIQGQADYTDDGVQDDDVIVYERTIRVPYASISEHGGQVTVNPRMKSYFLWKYSQTKERKWAYMAFSKTLNHKPFEFVKDSIQGMDANKIEPAVQRHVTEQLNKIPNLEVIIGNK